MSNVYQEDILHDGELDSDSDFIPEEPYDSDYEDPEPGLLTPPRQLAACVYSDSDSDIEFDLEGYESDTDYRERSDMHRVRYRQTATAPDQAQQDLNIKKILEQNKLEEQRLLRVIEEQCRRSREALKLKYKEELERDTKAEEKAKEAQIKMIENTDWSEYDPVIYEPDRADLQKVWTDAEVAAMRSSMAYTLCLLMGMDVYGSGDKMMRIRFAFKNDNNLTDNQRLWMLIDLITLKYGEIDDQLRNWYADFIDRKKFCNQYDADVMGTTWTQIKKMARLDNSDEFDVWEKERLRLVRRAKALTEAEANDESGLLAFIRQAPLGTTKASILFEQYLLSNPRVPLTLIKFGKSLKQHGIKIKQVKVNGANSKCYILDAASMDGFVVS